MPLNLAKRPFVDTRPVNALTLFLLALVFVLSIVSVKTFRAYLEGSRDTQAVITTLRGEIARYDNTKKANEAALARFDLGELGASAEDANEIARRRTFSWTRFLTRLEETLPSDVRVSGISLVRGAETSESRDGRGGPAKPKQPVGMPLNLILISRDPLGLPNTIRAFYASRYFDMPVPSRDESQEKGTPEGRRIALSVLYLDEGRPGFAPPSASAANVAVSAPVRTPAPRRAGKGSAR